MDSLVTLDAPAEATAALEAGQVLLLPQGGFTLTPTETALRDPRFLGAAKNISLSPHGDLKHSAASAQIRSQLSSLMGRYAGFATSLVHTIAPAYRGKLQRGRTSFRPAEIEGRKYSALKDDTRLHVDAFPTTPTQGKRILRVFCNVNETAPRLWHIGEPFEAVTARFLPQIKPKPAFVRALMAGLHITKRYRTAYDDVMVALHNRAKTDMNYQRHCAKTAVAFPPGAVWLCFTDQVMHAAVKGQHALEQTFYLPPAAQADPSTSPLFRLEQKLGRRLT
jgi:Protein of unknown function (DUF2843).